MADPCSDRGAEKRIILEMGSGNDLYGGDYTTAACRAVQDALHHSSIVLFRSLGYDHRDMRVQVTIGVQAPEQEDMAGVAAELPRGRAEVRAVFGGLDVHDAEQQTTHVIATAAVEAFLPIDAASWRRLVFEALRPAETVVTFAPNWRPARINASMAVPVFAGLIIILTRYLGDKDEERA